MAEKSKESIQNDLDRLQDRLKNLNQKIKYYSTLQDNPDQVSADSSSEPSPFPLNDTSMKDRRNKLFMINEYLRRRLSQKIPKVSVSATVREARGSVTKERPAESSRVPCEESAAVSLPQTGQPAGEGTSQRLGVGFDLGTTCLVAAREVEDKRVLVKNERNAFLSVRCDQSTQEILEKLKIKYVSLDDNMYVLGNLALNLASIFNREVQRSMDKGILNPTEAKSIPILKLIVQNILWPPRQQGEICCFSIPADPIDRDQDTIYHRGVFEKILRSIGFEPVIIDEGYAVVLSEMGDKEFTGIGVSCGGGMVNVCAAFKSVPLMSFSISRGGDWIDKSAASALGVPVSRVTTLKEQGISLKNPANREEEAIVIYYKNFIRYFLESMAQVFGKSSKGPQFKEPVDIVFTGGASMVNDFLDVVTEELANVNLGIPLGNIRRAEEPLTSVSRGCLFHSINSDKNN